jgi:hypothetical protein
VAFKDNLKCRSNTYVLKSKTKTHKEDECKECGHNPNDEYMTGLFRYKTRDMRLIRNKIEEHLTLHSNTESCTPLWCSLCKNLKQYEFKLRDPKKQRSTSKAWLKHAE